MSFINRKDENSDGRRMGIDERFDIVEAARDEYGLSSESARNIAACVWRFRNGFATEADMQELIEFREVLKKGTLQGRDNRAIDAIDRLEKM